MQLMERKGSIHTSGQSVEGQKSLLPVSLALKAANLEYPHCYLPDDYFEHIPDQEYPRTLLSIRSWDGQREVMSVEV